jgi:multimeric flavodoxin WrbA
MFNDNFRGFKMKVVAFNGSARKDGNTAILLKRVLSVLEAEGIETELIQLAGEQIHGCTACRACFKTKNQRCSISDDNVNAYIQRWLKLTA